MDSIPYFGYYTTRDNFVIHFQLSFEERCKVSFFRRNSMISGTNPLSSILQKMVSPINSGNTSVTNEKSVKLNELADSMKDQFSLSPSMSKMLEFLNSQPSTEADDDLGDLGNLANMKKKGEDLSNILQMKLQSFQGDLLKGMQTAGIDTSKEINLKDDGMNGVMLMNDHPDAQKIAELFEKENGLKEGFQEISKLADLVRSLQELSGDAAAGTMNLGNIAAKYAKESSSLNPEFMMKVLSTGASYTFE